MKHTILIILLLFLSASSHAQTADKPISARIKEASTAIQTGNYAIVIGVNDYHSDDITDLKYCENDARLFTDTLIAQGWNPNKITTMPGQKASYEEIYKAVNSITGMKMLPPGSTIIFFFSGHGVRVDDNSYLVPWDGSADPDLVKVRNIELDKIEDSIRRSPFDRKLLFIDACRNDISEGSKDISALDFGCATSPKGMRVILSTEKGQFSREDDTLKNGIFTYFLADGFSNRDADTDKDGIVILGELEVYVAKKMQDYGFKTRKTQRMVSDGECDPLVPLSIVGVPTPPPPPPPPKPEPVQPSLSDKSKWFSVKIELTNKFEGFEYTVDPETIDVELQGAVSLIDGINVYGNVSYIDVSKLTEGSYQFNSQNQLGLISVFPSPVSIVSVKQSGVRVDINRIDKPQPQPPKTGEIKNVTEIRTLSGHSEWVRSVAFSPDGKILASGSADKTIKFWSINDGHEIRTLSGHSDAVWSVAFSADGSKLASGSADQSIKIWSVSDGRQIRTFSRHSGCVNSVSFSPEGSKLASGSDDKTIKIWSVSDGHEIRTLSGHSDYVLSVAFSPDGSMLASGSYDATVRIWTVNDGQEIRAFRGYNSPCYSVVFSPDGNMLVGGVYNTIKIWSVSDGYEIRTLRGLYGGSVFSVAFSPDGSKLVSGSDDYGASIRIWSVSDGSEIRTLIGHPGYVTKIALSPDGKLLASGSGDKTIKLWSIEYE